MFCGFPVSVATLPTLAAVARAKRYGTAGSRSCRVTAITTGARTRQITSLTKRADSTPDARATIAKRPTGPRARRTAQCVTRWKKPDSLRYAATISMPKRSTGVWASTAATAFSHGITPATTITVAPMMATPVRSTRSPGRRPSASPRYVPTNAISATSLIQVNSGMPRSIQGGTQARGKPRRAGDSGPVQLSRAEVDSDQGLTRNVGILTFGRIHRHATCSFTDGGDLMSSQHTYIRRSQALRVICLSVVLLLSVSAWAWDE